MSMKDRQLPIDQVALPISEETPPAVAEENPVEDFAALGQYLRRERELRRISLDEIAQVTRINRRHLELLEAGEEKKLPAAPFLKGFLVAYARHIGIDPDEVLNRYIELTPAVKPTAGTSSGRRPLRPGIVRLIVVAVILLLLAGWWMLAARRSPAPSAPEAPADEAPPAPATPPQEDPVAVPEPPGQDEAAPAQPAGTLTPTVSPQGLNQVP